MLLLELAVEMERFATAQEIAYHAHLGVNREIQLILNAVQAHLPKVASAMQESMITARCFAGIMKEVTPGLTQLMETNAAVMI